MLEQGRELLHQAIRAGAIVVLTTGPQDSGERMVVRLLPAEPPPPGRAVVAEVEEGRTGLIESLVESATPVYGTIKAQWVAIAFQTPIVSQQRRLLGRRVTLRMPQQVNVEQRRRAPRERVPQEVRVPARMAPKTRGATNPPEVPAEVWDLSATGICLWCQGDGLPKQIKPGDELAVTLLCNGREHHLIARFRHRQPTGNGGVRLGLEFDSATAAPEVPAGQAVRSLIDMLAELRVRRNSEQFVARTLGLAG